MATISARTFTCGEVSAIDRTRVEIDLTDTSPGASRRLWLLTVRTDDGPAYHGWLSRLPVDDGAFHNDVPYRIAAALVAAAIRDGLVPVRREGGHG